MPTHEEVMPMEMDWVLRGRWAEVGVSRVGS